MKVYEFCFNPPSEKKKFLESDLVFQSFCFEPKNIYEKKMGSLYMVGLLKNVLPKNIYFLEKLAKFIKDGYYKKTIFSPEKSLRLVLRQTNEFLEEITKKGDVSWLGNLSFAILALKDFKLNFTKVGEIKIILLRAGKLIDIERKLKLQEIEPYPLKIFGNIVSGKLALNDLVLIFTQDIFEFFQSENLLNEIAKSPQILEEKLKNIFEEKKEELKETRGILLALWLVKEILPEKREIISSTALKEFSLKETFSPLFKFFKEKFALQLSKTKMKTWKMKTLLTKRWLLIIILILVLFFGSLLVGVEEKRKLRVYETDLKEIEINLDSAKKLLASKEAQNKEKAHWLLKESLKKISPMLKISRRLPKDFSMRVSSLNQEILEKLYFLNKLEKIENPEIYFQFDSKKFIPQKLIFFNEELYFFSSYSKNIFKLEKRNIFC